MGASVIAMGRNKDSLAFLKSKVTAPERVETVQITGDTMKDCQELKKHGKIDAFFDIGPPEAHASTHIKSSILSLRHGGRISLMGGYREGRVGTVT
jgi:threonine dehydrogenase-like Zn-dependent dehydrogenase